jgi:hypothetical protein
MFVKCKFLSAKIPLEIGENVKISFEHISNVLHVLLGVRPAPSKRTSPHKRSEYIDNLANNAWLRINNKFSYISQSGNECYYQEFTQGKKMPWNSNASNMFVTNEWGDNLPKIQGRLTWNSLKKRYYYVMEEQYNDIISTFEKISNMNIKEIKQKYSLYQFLYEYSKNEDNAKELEELGKRIKFTNLINFKDSAYFVNAGSPTNFAKLTINTNPTQKVTINGELIFNIKDKEIIDILKYHSTQHAKFLDGGLLKIEEIEEWLNIDGEYLEESELEEYGFKQYKK